MMLRVLSGILLAGLLMAGPAQAQIDQSEISDFVSKVKTCWNLTPDDLASGLSVKLRVELTESGALDSVEVLEADKSVAGKRIAMGAVRALELCAPYSFSAETYDQWQTIDITLQP